MDGLWGYHHDLSETPSCPSTGHRSDDGTVPGSIQATQAAFAGATGFTKFKLETSWMAAMHSSAWEEFMDFMVGLALLEYNPIMCGVMMYNVNIWYEYIYIYNVKTWCEYLTESFLMEFSQQSCDFFWNTWEDENESQVFSSPIRLGMRWLVAWLWVSPPFLLLKSSLWKGVCGVWTVLVLSIQYLICSLPSKQKS